MKPVTRPETQLFCHNPDCGYADESWRFGAVGGDDVTYSCPKCKALADVVALKKTEEIPVAETEKSKETVMTRRKMDFIVVDLEKRTLKVIPEDRVKDEGDDVDLLLPLISPQEVQQLQRRAAKDFDANMNELLNNLEAGTLPYDATIDAWLQQFGISLYESAEPPEIVAGDPNDLPEDFFDEDEELKEISDLPVQTPRGVDGSAFVAGFQTGVSFALNNLHLFLPAPVEEPAPTPTAPPQPRASKDKAVKLLRLLKAKVTPKPPKPVAPRPFRAK
jgi:hypothetical protein